MILKESSELKSKFLSDRDRELIDKHRTKIVDNYSPGGFLSSWGRYALKEPQRAIHITDTILSAGILPQPLSRKEVKFLVSVSSNTGLIEQRLAIKLGKSYKIIAGDISNIARVRSNAIPMTLDASFLPFKSESIAAILDIKGAIWHEAREDEVSYGAKNVLDIFARLRTPLQVGGVLIVDDHPFMRGSFSPISTGSLINNAMITSREKIEGFRVFTIGNDDRRLRVYKKV